MAMMLLDNSIVVVIIILLLMVLLLILLILLACKPWRFLINNIKLSSRTTPHKVDDEIEIERPLVSSDTALDSTDDSIKEYDLEGACFHNEGLSRPPGLVYKQRIPPKIPLSNHNHGSCLSLDVTSGPSLGINYTVHSTDASRLPLTIGRIHSSDLVLKDSEVSGKHAMINWNSNKKKWELVDMGSLNGTLLNSKPANHPDSGSRHWGDPFDLSTGDMITLGTTSNLSVCISSQTESKSQIPFSIGIASDPMALRRGGKKLPMEDMCYYEWPIPGTDQFGLFGICDGHGGAAAAKTASKIFPEVVASILSDSLIREKVLTQCDASDVLRDAFSQTEDRMNHHQYEGCTATLLLVWADGKRKFAQCANLGDSACVINVEGKYIKMTEDHRITSYSERLRLNETGEPLRDGETRLCGLNLARMLGDKFLKEQEARFSAKPYISEVVHIDLASGAFALLASDGFWDVISVKKAVQLVNQTRERYSMGEENPAVKVANLLLNEARTLRTKDNTSIIFLDFDRISSCSSPMKVSLSGSTWIEDSMEEEYGG
ncbi:hypothetical protein ACFE04_005528 [Oxalis oulophora]